MNQKTKVKNQFINWVEIKNQSQTLSDFELFQRTKSYFTDLNKVADAGYKLADGYLYLDSCYVEIIENKQGEIKYHTLVTTEECESNELVEVERFLFENWVKHELQDTLSQFRTGRYSRIPYFDKEKQTDSDYLDLWIEQLYNTGLAYHFEDSPNTVGNTINNNWVKTFNDVECQELEEIVPRLFLISGYDPFKKLVELNQ